MAWSRCAGRLPMPTAPRGCLASDWSNSPEAAWLTVLPPMAGLLRGARRRTAGTR
jgi:hypothetical protein